jgi:GNAT superfamily N-acetyltransferase
MERILEKASKFKYTSMEYVDAEDLEGTVVIFDTEAYIFILKELEDKNRIYWAANSRQDFFDAFSMLRNNMGKDKKRKPLFLNFIPKDFVGELEAEGLKICGEFVDYWKPNLKIETSKNKSSYVVRPIRVEEYSAASKITLRCKEMSRGFTGETEELVKQWSESENSIILAAEGNKGLVGVCFLNLYGFESEKGTVLWLRELAVDPKHHSRGIGRALIEAAIAWGIENGAKRSFLACDTENYNAIKLYESCGYKRKLGRGEINMIEKDII